jgi:hypothetical protein
MTSINIKDGLIGFSYASQPTRGIENIGWLYSFKTTNTYTWAGNGTYYFNGVNFSTNSAALVNLTQPGIYLFTLTATSEYSNQSNTLYATVGGTEIARVSTYGDGGGHNGPFTMCATFSLSTPNALFITATRNSNQTFYFTNPTITVCRIA